MIMADAFAAMTVIASTTFMLLLFLSALWHKLADFQRFSGFVADYRLLPAAFAPFAAAGVATVEALTIALLALPATRPSGAVAAMTLLAVYAGAIAINAARGRTRLACGCGGADQRVGWALVVRNALLMLLALPAALFSPATQGAAQIAAGLAAGLLLWLFYHLSELLLANNGRIQLSDRPQT